MKIYNECADWFHLLTHPSEYAEEAADYVRLIEGACPDARTLLELGAGGGNNAFHMKRRFSCTLTDLSPRMLEVSRSINPDCEHLAGDMRELRLGREFDAVFLHDAVEYMTTHRRTRARRRDGIRPHDGPAVWRYSFPTVPRKRSPSPWTTAATTGRTAARFAIWSGRLTPIRATACTNPFRLPLARERQRPRRARPARARRCSRCSQWRQVLSAAGFAVTSPPLDAVVHEGQSRSWRGVPGR